MQVAISAYHLLKCGFINYHILSRLYLFPIVDSFGYNPGNRTVTVNFVNPLPAGSSGDIELKVRFAKGSTLDGATAVNTATIDADNSLPDTSDPVTITARAENKASISKSLLGGSIPLDQNVTYQVRLNNSATVGALDLSGITLVDTLPAGSEFVSASGVGSYDALAETVTWTAGSLTAGSSLVRTVTVKFPSSIFVTGNNVTNHLSVTYTPGGETETTETDSVTHGIVAPIGGHSFSKSVANNYTYEGKEASKTWTFTLKNTGNVPMENVVVVDPIPEEVNVTRVYIGRLQGTPAGLNDPVNVFYKSNLTGAWTAFPGNPYAGTTNQSETVSGLGLAGNEYITDIKWDFGNLPVGYEVKDLKFDSTILTTDRSGDPVLADQDILNVADLTYEDYRGPQSDDDDALVTPRSPRAVAELAKDASPTVVNDGESTTYSLRFINSGLANRDLVNPEYADLLDAKLQFVPGSYQVVSKPAGAPDPIFEVINDYNGSGRTLLRWKFSGASAYDLAPGKEIRVSFDALIPAGTIYGNIGNDAAITGWDNSVIDTRNISRRDDTQDLDGDSDTAEDIFIRNRKITVRGRASMDSVKWVKGELDADWSKFPDSGRTVPGGQADYRLIVKNTGNVPIYDAVVLDILPVLGDTGVIDLSLRETEWIAALAGPVVAPPGVTVYYSRRSDPTRPDFDSDGPVGSLPAEWSATPPATITDARSLLFVFDSVVIQPAEEFELTWPMRSPVGTWERTGEVVEDLDDVTVPANQKPELTLTKTGTFRSGTGPCDTLGMGKHFNALIFGNLDAQGGDTDGRLAVGGNATIPSAYSVGIPIKGDPIAPIIGSDTDMFIVGGDLVDGVWGVNGNLVFAGTRTGPYRYQINGNVTRQVIPVTFDSNGNVPADGSGASFDDLLAEMQARSALFGALDDRGVVSVDDTVPYQLTLVGNDPALNVFNVTAAQWSVTSSNINISVPNGATVLVNIHGTPVNIVNGGMVLNGTSSRTTLYNYVDALEVNTSGFTHYGSVLAPYASANFSGGGIDGTAVFGADVYT